MPWPRYQWAEVVWDIGTAWAHRVSREINIMSRKEKCAYKRLGSDGHGTDWETECGRRVRCSGPMDVGMSFDPMPNEDGEFCHYCGGVIKPLEAPGSD
jgi:hypothetical protein